MPNCKGICSRFAAPNPMTIGSRYKTAKRCSSCEVWIKKTYKRCPCCNGPLKVSPNAGRGKARLLNH